MAASEAEGTGQPIRRRLRGPGVVFMSSSLGDPDAVPRDGREDGARRAAVEDGVAGSRDDPLRLRLGVVGVRVGIVQRQVLH